MDLGDLIRKLAQESRRGGGRNVASATNVGADGVVTSVYSDDDVTVIRHDGETQVIRNEPEEKP